MISCRVIKPNKTIALSLQWSPVVCSGLQWSLLALSIVVMVRCRGLVEINSEPHRFIYAARAYCSKTPSPSTWIHDHVNIQLPRFFTEISVWGRTSFHQEQFRPVQRDTKEESESASRPVRDSKRWKKLLLAENGLTRLEVPRYRYQQVADWPKWGDKGPSGKWGGCFANWRRKNDARGTNLFTVRLTVRLTHLGLERWFNWVFRTSS